jgi:GTP pyrophosphokinase
MKKVMVFDIEGTLFEVPVTEKAKVQAAFDFMIALYKNRQRDNGDPFWWHPLSTVWIMQNWFGHSLSDEEVVIALLHDALWVDYDRTKDSIRSQFGEDILVSVSLLTKPHIVEKRTKQKEDEEVQFARLIQSGRKDLLLIKYAERLHNMLELTKTDRIKQERFLDITKRLYIDRFPEDAGLATTVQTVFKEKYYEIIAELNIQV